MENKTAWLESQYLFPQHFQQHERYLEQRLEQRAAAISPYIWGFSELALDKAALGSGRFALSGARGIMPDGTPFELPDSATLPRPVMIPPGTRNSLLYLVLPGYQPGSRYLETGAEEEAGDPIVRYLLRMQDVFDYAVGGGKPEQVETAVLNCSLVLEHEDLGGYTVLPVARVREVSREGAVLLDPAFIPPVLTVAASARLQTQLAELLGLVQQRGEALALRFTESGKAGGTSAITDFLLLQLINRYEPRLRHMNSLPLLHPRQLYLELLGLSGELATFTTDAKRPGALPSYRHHDLAGSFQPLGDLLARELSAVLEQTAMPLPLEERQYGIRVARIPDPALLRQARFVLSARAEQATDTTREQLPALIRTGAVETIRDLVNNQLPGIALKTLSVAPREIPYHAGSVYFELDADSGHWQQLRHSGGFAFHVSGDLPGLKLELWAIRL